MPNDPSPKQLTNLENTGVKLPIPTYKQVLKCADPSSAAAVTTCLCNHLYFTPKSSAGNRCMRGNAVRNGLFNPAVHQGWDDQKLVASFLPVQIKAYF